MDGKTAESLLGFAETSRTGLTGFDSKAVLAELDRLYLELLVALQWFIDEGRPDDSFRLAAALVPFWEATKRIDEGDTWFERALAAPGGSALARGRALYEHGLLIFWAGHYERSGSLLAQALEVGRGTGDPTVTALALAGLARIAARTDVDEAKRLLHEALSVTEGTADRLGRSNAMHVLGVAAQMSGDFEEARRVMTERIALAREAGNYATIGYESGNLSMVERQLGNLDRAEALSREAIEIVSRRGDELGIPWMVNGLAAVTAARGDLERAATLIGIADVTIERAGGEWPPDERVQYDGTVATLTARMGTKSFERARARGYSMTTPDGVALALEPAPSASERV